VTLPVLGSELSEYNNIDIKYVLMMTSHDPTDPLNPLYCSVYPAPPAKHTQTLKGFDSKGIQDSQGKDFHHGKEEGKGGLQCIAENRH